MVIANDGSIGSIRLRDATLDDIRALHALDQLCYPPGIAYSTAEMRYYLRRAGAVSVLAEKDASELAGFAIAEPIRYGKLNGAHLITIDVAIEYRRQGVGSHLMNAIDERLREAGVQVIRLEVAVDNAAAQEFYRHRGFETLGKIRGYYLGTLDALVMEKRFER